MWIKMTPAKFKESVSEPLKRAMERWAQVAEEIATSEMPYVWVAWSDECVRSIDRVSSAARTTLLELDNQVSAIRNGTKCDIELNKERNKKAAPVASTPRIKKKKTK